MAKPRKKMLRVSQLSYVMAQRGWENVPSPKQLYHMASSAQFEAMPDPVSHIWHVDESRIDEIAMTLGLTKAEGRIAA